MAKFDCKSAHALRYKRVPEHHYIRCACAYTPRAPLIRDSDTRDKTHKQHPTHTHISTCGGCAQGFGGGSRNMMALLVLGWRICVMIRHICMRTRCGAAFAVMHNTHASRISPHVQHNSRMKNARCACTAHGARRQTSV